MLGLLYFKNNNQWQFATHFAKFVTHLIYTEYIGPPQIVLVTGPSGLNPALYNMPIGYVFVLLSLYSNLGFRFFSHTLYIQLVSRLLFIDPN